MREPTTSARKTLEAFWIRAKTPKLTGKTNVPCYTKYVENFNSTTIFYKIPNRNFLSLPESSMFDPVGKEEIPTYLSYAVSKMAKLNNSKPFEIAAWPQLLGRNTGAFTHTEVKNFLNKADGSLTMVDNEPRHLGVVTNLDYIEIDKHPLKYSDFKVYDEEQKKPPGKKEPLPILDSATNLKIAISWDDWSCCSACCCTSMLCGKFYTPDRKCNRLHSVKVRKGYLSLMKINPEEPIRPWDRNDVNVGFQTMMSISPYKEKGIALFSTIWDSSDYLREAQIYKERLYRDRFKSVSNITNEVGVHPGIYLDEAPCTQEKYDCVKLARCRGIDITSKIDEELEVEVDPCAEYESEIEIIFIEEDHTEVPLFAGKNYRIRLREEVFSTDATQARWKVSSRPPAHFDRSKMCLEQGIVLQKNGDLLMTRLTSKDVRRHVEVTLSDGRKISIQFTNAGLKLGLGDDRDVLIMWAVILTGKESPLESTAEEPFGVVYLLHCSIGDVCYIGGTD
nr:Hypothetical protein CBG08756 [Haemonchus contortus]